MSNGQAIKITTIRQFSTAQRSTRASMLISTWQETYIQPINHSKICSGRRKQNSHK